jgi:hypothetical protein
MVPLAKHGVAPVKVPLSEKLTFVSAGNTSFGVRIPMRPLIEPPEFRASTFVFAVVVERRRALFEKPMIKYVSWIGAPCPDIATVTLSFESSTATICAVSPETKPGPGAPVDDAAIDVKN